MSVHTLQSLQCCKTNVQTNEHEHSCIAKLTTLIKKYLSALTR